MCVIDIRYKCYTQDPSIKMIWTFDFDFHVADHVPVANTMTNYLLMIY